MMMSMMNGNGCFHAFKETESRALKYSRGYLPQNPCLILVSRQSSNFPFLRIIQLFPKTWDPNTYICIYRPQNTIVLIIGTPRKVPIILGKPHIFAGKSCAADLRANSQPPSHSSGVQLNNGYIYIYIVNNRNNKR